MEENKPTLDRYQAVYESRAVMYARLVAAEDADGILQRAVLSAASPKGATLLDVGAGTGRVSRWLQAAGARVVAVEPARAMRVEAANIMASEVAPPYWIVGGEAGALPMADDSVDGAVEGWAFGHVRSWAPDSWRDEARRMISELGRVVRPGGPIVLIETAGTCVDEPNPPEDLVELYEFWRTLGFDSEDYRSDYEFDSVEVAASIMGAFFGPEMAARVSRRASTRVPEFTRVFTRHR